MHTALASQIWIHVALAVVAASVCAQPAESQSAPTPARYLVDFSAENNLKVLFDAGLRPTRFPGLETRTCEIGRVDLTIRLPNGNEFDIDVQRASFGVRAENELGSARIFGVDEQVATAASRVKAIAAAMGLSDEGLDEIIDNFGTTLDPNKRWHRAGRIDDLTVGITFYPMFYRSGVMARAWVQLIWRREPGTYRFLTEPIQPPPGYEHISMAPTPFPTPPPIETHTPRTEKRVSTPAPTGSGAPSPTAPPARTTVSPSETPASPVPMAFAEKESGPARWVWTIAGIALGLLAALIFVARKRGKETRAGTGRET